MKGRKSTKQDAMAFYEYLSTHKSSLNAPRLNESGKSVHEPQGDGNLSEIALQRQIVRYLQFEELQGKLFFHRANTVGIYDKSIGGYRRLPNGTKAGFPDIVIIKDGKFIGVELKKSKGKQSEDQKKVEEMIVKAGGTYWVIRTIDYFIKLLEEYGTQQ